jgi:hypothetical protein
MIRRYPSSICRCPTRVGTILLCLCIAGPFGLLAQTSLAQTSRADYYEICRQQGFLPGTTPMRRCIDAQRSIDLDPLNALSDYELTSPDGQERAAEGTPELPDEFPGARSARELLEGTPEDLLLGPDYRARGQGIYE